FLNIGGKKMSTSKGLGAAAHSFVDVVPAEQVRLLFLRPRPNHAIDFDPNGTDAIPRLFDEFDRLAAATAGREVRGDLPPGYQSIFRYSLLDAGADVAGEATAFRIAFRRAAMFVQGRVDPQERARAEKGADVTGREVSILSERLSSARAWLESCAPADERFSIVR